MTDSGNLAEYFGFTETEVQELCEKYEMSFEEARAWYNGLDGSDPFRAGIKGIADNSFKNRNSRVGVPVFECCLSYRKEKFFQIFIFL